MLNRSESANSNEASVASSTPSAALVNWGEPLSVFLLGLDQYKPTVPEAVAQYYAQKAGASADDPRFISVIALAADKFLCDIVNDARQFSQLRQKGNNSAAVPLPSKGKRKAGASVAQSVAKQEIFEMEDLERSLEQRNIYVRRKIGVTAEIAMIKKK
jgi:transcription initiation factor TFIID subunit 10